MAINYGKTAATVFGMIGLMLASVLGAFADSIIIPETLKSQDGWYSYNIAVNEKTNTIYVTHPNSNFVSVIDATTNNLTDIIPIGLTPVEIAVNPNTNLVYVGNSDSGTVSVIDGLTNVIVKTLNVSNYRSGFNSIAGIAVNEKTDKVYVLTHEVAGSAPYASMTVIDGLTNDVEKAFKVAELRLDWDVHDSARGLAVNSDKHDLRYAGFRRSLRN